MRPSVGDIYCVYSDKLQQYVACQITMLRETDSKRNPQQTDCHICPCCG